MIVDFLNRQEGNTRLIVIFAGWSTGPELYGDITREGWDVAVCHSYTSLDLPKEVAEEWRKHYLTVMVYAWSFGVFAAMHTLRDLRVTAAYALNGTGVPVDEERGIAPAIFEGTLRGLNPRSLAKFRRRMVISSEEMQSIMPCLDPEPDIESLQAQLRAISAAPPVTDGGGLRWRRVFISEDDKIIPADSQRRYWEEVRQRYSEDGKLSGPEIVNLSGGHFVALRKIVDWTLPRPERVGDKFRDALTTYNDHATAQRIIAGRLTDMIPFGSRAERLLEIGAGAGLFTRMYSVRVEVEEAVFIDLCRPLDEFGIARREEYAEGDAERWMDTVPAESFDMIVSASAIQWFVDPERFFANAKRILRPGGQLAVSSFVTGNLSELDGIRPTPIPYCSVGELTEMVMKYFPEAEVKTDEITLLFPTAREALIHLRRTGVGGSASNPATLRALLRALTPAEADTPVRLTFRPVWITAVK